MDDKNQKLIEILDKFKEHIQSREVEISLEIMKRERIEVKELMVKLSQMDKESKDFTDLVLYGLLPYSKTKDAKRVSLFPAFMNIRLFFKEYKYTEKEWNIVAKKIFKLCERSQSNPDQISEIINEFTSDKYSQRLQCGSISPILFCLNDTFPVVNNRTIRAFRSINLILGNNEKLSQKLTEYSNNIVKIDKLFATLEMILDRDHQDLLFYWYDAETLSEDRREKKEGVEDETIEEVESEVKSEIVGYSDLLRKIDLKKDFNFEPHSLGDPQRIKISQVINKCGQAKWVLPHFQRYFDWTKTDVNDLWESIFHDYYVGSFLLWETGKNPELGIQCILGVAQEEELRPEAIVLDGQQRITSLYYAIKAPLFPLRGSKQPLYYYINFHTYFNKDSDKGVIEIHVKKFSQEETFDRMLFPLFKLEKYNAWIDGFEDFLLNKNEDSDKIRGLRRVIDKKLRHIWDGFEIPYIALPESMELYQVTDIFEKINTKGKLLSVFDLLIARLYKENLELKRMWDATLKNYPNIHRYSKNISKIPVYILQTMSILYEKNNSAKRADILNIYVNVYKDSGRDFEEDWDDISDYMNRAIEKLENLKDGFGIKYEKELPFEPMIPVLAALLKQIDLLGSKAEHYKKLSMWYWSAVFANAYSQAADSQMTIDFKDMKIWLYDDLKIPRTIERMRKEFVLLDFKKIQSMTNAKYKGVMSIFAIEGAKDFATSLTLENARSNDKDHIFPSSRRSDFGVQKEIDSVLNITWMSKETNEYIKRAKKPSVYVPEFTNEKYNGKIEDFKAVLKTHLINEVAFESLLTDNYLGFLAEREVTILEKISNLIGIEYVRNGRTLISPETPFTNKIIFYNTIKSCSDFIYWADKYFSQAGLEHLSESVNKDKVKEIKVITSIDKANLKFRDLFKDFRDEFKNKGIKAELRVIVDSELKDRIHDRWIITKGQCFNIPSPDTIERGQFSEIKKTDNRPPFQDWWSNTKDIILEWDEIAKYIKPAK